MERMTKVDENIQTAQNMLSGIVERCYELEEGNKKLKSESEELKMWLREKLPLALLKEYMEKFEGVDLKNV